MKLFTFAIVIVLMSGCADTVTFEQAETANQVGFLFGLWHGMIAPFAWIASLFDDSVSIYAIYNNGGWYDFGFMLGIGALSSSTTSRAK